MLQKMTVFWVLLFTVYFAVHALIRTSIGWFLTEDELAIMRDAQQFAWVYNGDMPLYAWSQAAIFDAFGTTLLSITLLKNSIMLLICLAVFTLVQRVSNTGLAFAATVSMLFLPQISWTSQHTLTTPVLATLFAATTLLSFSRLSDKQSFFRYVLLGSMVGLGAISSVYYLIIPAALFPAAIMSSDHRHLVFNKFFALTVIIACAIAAKPYQEFFSAVDLVLPTTSEFYPISAELVVQHSLGTYNALQTVLAFTSILIVVSAIAVYSGLGRNTPINQGTRNLRELLLKTISIGLLIVFGIAFFFGSEWMDQTKLQPLLFMTAPVVALYLFPVMSVETHRYAVRTAAAIATVLLLVTPAHYSFNLGSDDRNQLASIETVLR